MNLIEKIFGTHSDREIKRIRPIVDQIVALKPQMVALAPEDAPYEEQQRAFSGKTQELKNRLANGETLDDILPEAYALVREAARRILHTEHYEEQLMGGIILHQGRISEMKTGEGKTQTCLLPAYLNALEGKGVHVITVNDYLAERDKEWMGMVHSFLGLTVGVVLNSATQEERKAAYSCDITYITNSELGFDYLRDNMAIYKEQLVQRELHYAIIDEVDSVLIDEARTPLIISGKSDKPTQLYEQCNRLARQFKKGVYVDKSSSDYKLEFFDRSEEEEEDGDFVVDEKNKNVILTANGVEKVERFFHIENLADEANIDIQHNVILALRALHIMARDKDYIVDPETRKVMIVDEFTGRVMPGRRYSDGLHQAIEAKEGVEIQNENRTVATITYQSFFNKYEKKAGMTGTAQTEEKEFREIYGMDVVVVPTHKPVARIDHNDVVFKTHKAKINAVVQEIIETHATGQPILVGTVTIEQSHELYGILKRMNIPCRVLNAVVHREEADIVSHAGEHGAITIATNMAGRGTDIKLDPAAKAAGGLKIIGTVRHESRRIDNQLRGRSGRQGDPGESRFYISLEDDLFRRFGSEKMMKMFQALPIPDDEPIEHKMLTNVIESSQHRIEDNHFSMRKNLMEYDQVNNDQREIIYDERRRVLDGENMRGVIMKMMNDRIESIIDDHIREDMTPDTWTGGVIAEMNHAIHDLVPMEPIGDVSQYNKKGELIHDLKERAVSFYEHFEAAVEAAVGNSELMRELERVSLLRAIDSKWMNHIDDMDQLRQGIGLQSYGQRNPVVEYKMAGFDMFDEMTDAIAEETVKRVFHTRITVQAPEREQVVKVTGTNQDASQPKAPVKRSDKKIMPNDPCPCGSGLKYKKCTCAKYHK